MKGQDGTVSKKKRIERSQGMDYAYLIKVYADAVEIGREIETIPEIYIKEVRRELDRRGWVLKSRKTE